MRVIRDTTKIPRAGRRGPDTNRRVPRLSADKKEEVAALISRLRFLLGTQIDSAAHTVQVVFTSDVHESVILIQGD